MTYIIEVKRVFRKYGNFIVFDNKSPEWRHYRVVILSRGGAF